ncbi:MAG: response regulator [Nitrospinae bacterium]|nr:response regulator [Nitrospinota bacterium]
MHTVLLVDDDELTLSILTRFLSNNGFQVKSASDGVDALRMLDSESFDLVISDVSMAEMDGITLLKTIRENGNDVPFIVVTGHPKMDGYINAVQKFGAFEYLQKPIELEMLNNVIRRLVG